MKHPVTIAIAPSELVRVLKPVLVDVATT